MISRLKVVLAAALVGLLAGASLSDASTVTFSGSGSSGTLVTTAGNYAWAYPGVSSGTFAWGIPGLGDGDQPWGGATSASEFTVTFTGLPGGVVINPIGPNFTDTRFFDDTTAAAWTGVITGNSIDFKAPAGTPLVPGDAFFVNIVFSATAGSTVNFSGAFDPAAVTTGVPLPSALGMGGISLALGLGCALLAKRRNATIAL